MEKLICDICGGKLVMQSGGLPKCDSCGMEYSKERIREKVQEIKGIVRVGNIADIESLIKRGWIFLEDGDWKQAGDCFDKILEIDPEHGAAYVGNLCVDLIYEKEADFFERESDLADCNVILDDFSNYRKALRFGDDELCTRLRQYNQTIKNNIPKRFAALKSYQELKYQTCIAAGESHTVGLKTDGTLMVIGDGHNVTAWKNIVEIAANLSYTVGLKVDGTFIGFTGSWSGSDYTNWRDLIAIAAGVGHIVGLKADGTVIVKGSIELSVATLWEGINAIAAGDGFTIGLKKDGTCVASYNTHWGNSMMEGVISWREVVAITAGVYHTIGLKADGTVLAIGSNEYYQCNVSDWRDIVAIAAGENHSIGLKADGTVIAVGDNLYGQCNVSDWHDIVAVAAGWTHTVGVKADGTVIAIGRNNCGQCNVSNWHGIGPISKEDRIRLAKQEESSNKERQRQWQEQVNNWQNQGLCRFCGGKLKGIFNLKCKSCDKDN